MAELGLGVTAGTGVRVRLGLRLELGSVLDLGCEQNCFHLGLRLEQNRVVCPSPTCLCLWHPPGLPISLDKDPINH